MAEKRRKLRQDLGLNSIVLLVLIGATFVAYLFLGHPAPIFSIGGLVLFILVVGKIDRTIIPVMDELQLCERNAVKGAKAEEKISGILDKLGDECVMVHDVNKGQGNIDHLAFRKDGAVFLIETKSHRGNIAQQDGELRRNGQPLEKNFIRQTHQNVSWLKEFLKARLGFEPQWIHAAIVFSNAYVEKHLEMKGVAVMNAGFLSEWIRRQPGNPKVAAHWPEIENLKSELSSSAPNHLAP
jgi:Nuclease-related domain